MTHILDTFAPKTDTMDVVLPDGTKIPFKRLSDGAEIDRLSREATEWAAKMLRNKSIQAAWKNIFVHDAAALAKVFILTKLALHEELQSEQAVLTLYRKAGPVFATIIAQIDYASASGRGASEGEVHREEGNGYE
jgi:hypothetical protein